MVGILVLLMMCLVVLAGAHVVVKNPTSAEPHSIEDFQDYFIK
ncbi:hypothetical protein [Thalassobacillus devorans]|nr:hypothetical protein [Thalassobacillus devorans]